MSFEWDILVRDYQTSLFEVWIFFPLVVRLCQTQFSAGETLSNIKSIFIFYFVGKLFPVLRHKSFSIILGDFLDRGM